MLHRRKFQSALAAPLPQMIEFYEEDAVELYNLREDTGERGEWMRDRLRHPSGRVGGGDR